METYVVVDFEANGFATPDVEREACLYFLRAYASRNIQSNYKNKLNALFLELDYSFAAMEWGSPDNTEQFDDNFSHMWAEHKQKRDVEWTRTFVQKALNFLDSEFQWKLFTVTKQEGENQIQKDHLCYAENVQDIINNKLSQNFKSFDVKDEKHRAIVLNAYFGPTILSCALLHMKKNGNKIEIIRHGQYQQSRSKTDCCYYQVFKPDEHYVHSSDAQRIHRLSREWLIENGVKISNMISQFVQLTEESENVKFVAHNFKADQKYLRHTIQRYISLLEYRHAIYSGKENETITRLNKLLEYIEKDRNWICTLTKAREKYTDTKIYNLSSLYKKITKKRMSNAHDAQMDVYACATIFCDIKNVNDRSALEKLIEQVQSSEIACQKPKDFWRYAVRTRDGKAKEAKPENFIILNKWMICLKWDGFYVRLKRDEGRWRMYTRSGNELRPPTSFLEHVSLDLPDGMEMEGELVFDSNQRCEIEDRNNIEKRIEKRTRDFQKLHFSSLRSTKNFKAWHGLRLVLFAFPQDELSFFQSFKLGKPKIMESQKEHPHITVCNYYVLTSTEQAIEIFKCVVQMGCEGVIVRNPHAVYNTKSNEDKYKSDIFKLKQKIVTEEEQQFRQVGEPKMNKDGKEKEEYEYVVPAYKKKAGDAAREIKFRDWRSGNAGPGGIITKKLKYHEKAKGKMAWDLNEIGMRHTSFATDTDMSVEVEAKRDLNSELVKIVDSISVKTEPFQFIVETAYVFLDFLKRADPTGLGTGTIHIGILRFVGKTDGEIKPQFFLHKEYERDKFGPKDQQYVADMMQVLHHVPNNNQRLVFVVRDKHKLEDFRKYTLELIHGGGHLRYNNLPREIMHRLFVNDTARKQQVDVILMEEWKNKGKFPEFFKTLISWNSDSTAGYIKENPENLNTLSALVSPQLSDEQFQEMCEKQFANYVYLQNTYHYKEERSEDLEIERLATLYGRVPQENYKGIPTEDYFNKLSELKLQNEVRQKALYHTLLEYDKEKTDNKGRITLPEFKTIFETARHREQNCPVDPRIHKFPYTFQDEKKAWHMNVWHRAWRMSEAFFRYKNMPVSREAPGEFKQDLDLWLPVIQHVESQPTDRESSPEESVDQRIPNKKIEEKKIEPKKYPDRPDRNPKKIARKLGGYSSEDETSQSRQESKRPKEREKTPEESKRQNEKDKTPHSDLVLTGVKAPINPRETRKESAPSKRDREEHKTNEDTGKKPKSEPERPSVEEWLRKQPDKTPESASTPKDESHKPSQRALDWLNSKDEAYLVEKKLQKIKVLLQVLKTYAL